MKIQQNGRRKINTLKTVMVVFIVTAFCCLVWGVKEQLPEWSLAYKNEELKKRVVLDITSEENDTSADSQNNEVSGPLSRRIDFGYLQEINPDIVAWIYIPGTRIDYPILQGEDLEYYLSHAYDGSSNRGGSIFTYPKTDMSDQHMFLFGHRLRSGRMFGNLQKYENLDFAREHPVYIYTPEDIREYKAFACYCCETGHETFTVTSPGQIDDYLVMIAQTAEYYDADLIDSIEEDVILTLSTCPARDSENNRFVVQCVMGGVYEYD